MAREPAIDGAPIGLERVGRWVIDEYGVCPSLRVGESLVSFSIRRTSCKVSGTFTEKGASVLFVFSFSLDLRILEPSE